MFVTVTAELPLVAAPIVVHLYKSFEEHFLAEEFFYVFTGVDAYLFYFFAAFGRRTLRGFCNDMRCAV